MCMPHTRFSEKKPAVNVCMCMAFRAVVITVGALLVGVPCSQATVATISSFCGLQRALQDASVVHIVVMEHLFFDPGTRCSGTKADAQNSLTDSNSASSVARASGVECDSERQRKDRDIEDGSEARTPCGDEAEETVLLPLHVQGNRKTIRGACETEPAASSYSPSTHPKYVRRPLQCVIQIPSTFIAISRETSAGSAENLHLSTTQVDSSEHLGRRKLLEASHMSSESFLRRSLTSDAVEVQYSGSSAAVWLSDLLIMPQGRIDGDWASDGTSAVIEATNGDVWLTGVSVIGNTGTCATCMNRALSVKNARIYSKGCYFSQLKMISPSPVLLLDSGSAAFHSATFQDITGPRDCTAMHAYSGGILLEASTFMKAPSLYHEHQICLSDSRSKVYGSASLVVDKSASSSVADAAAKSPIDTSLTSPSSNGKHSHAEEDSEHGGDENHAHDFTQVWIVDLEDGESVTPVSTSESKEHSPRFLSMNAAFESLVQEQAEATSMQRPPSVDAVAVSSVVQPSIDSISSGNGTARGTIVAAAVAAVLLSALGLIVILVISKLRTGSGQFPRGHGKVESRVLSTVHTGPNGSFSSTYPLPSVFLLNTASPSAHGQGGDGRARTFAYFKQQNCKLLQTHAPHAHSTRLSTHGEPWWTDFTRVLSSQGQKGSGMHAAHASSWQPCFSSREHAGGASLTSAGGVGVTPVFKPPYSCMSVPSQDSSQMARSTGHQRVASCGTLPLTDSMQSLKDSSLFLPLPPVAALKSSAAHASHSTGSAPPLSHHSTDKVHTAHACTHHSAAMHGHGVRRVSDSAALTSRDSAAHLSPRMPLMHRGSESSAPLATPTHALRRSPMPSALLTTPPHPSSSSRSGDMGITYGSLQSVHAGHAYMSQDQSSRKPARWNTMSQEEIASLTTVYSTSSVRHGRIATSHARDSHRGIPTHTAIAASESLTHRVQTPCERLCNSTADHEGGGGAVQSTVESSQCENDDEARKGEPSPQTSTGVGTTAVRSQRGIDADLTIGCRAGSHSLQSSKAVGTTVARSQYDIDKDLGAARWGGEMGATYISYRECHSAQHACTDSTAKQACDPTAAVSAHEASGDCMHHASLSMHSQVKLPGELSDGSLHSMHATAAEAHACTCVHTAYACTCAGDAEKACTVNSSEKVLFSEASKHTSAACMQEQGPETGSKSRPKRAQALPKLSDQNKPVSSTRKLQTPVATGGVTISRIQGEEESTHDVEIPTGDQMPPNQGNLNLNLKPPSDPIGAPQSPPPDSVHSQIPPQLSGTAPKEGKGHCAKPAGTTMQEEKLQASVAQQVQRRARSRGRGRMHAHMRIEKNFLDNTDAALGGELVEQATSASTTAANEIELAMEITVPAASLVSASGTAAVVVADNADSMHACDARSHRDDFKCRAAEMHSTASCVCLQHEQKYELVSEHTEACGQKEVSVELRDTCTNISSMHAPEGDEIDGVHAGGNGVPKVNTRSHNASPPCMAPLLATHTRQHNAAPPISVNGSGVGANCGVGHTRRSRSTLRKPAPWVRRNAETCTEGKHVGAAAVGRGRGRGRGGAPYVPVRMGSMHTATTMHWGRTRDSEKTEIPGLNDHALCPKLRGCTDECPVDTMSGPQVTKRGEPGGGEHTGRKGDDVNTGRAGLQRRQLLLESIFAVTVPAMRESKFS